MSDKDEIFEQTDAEIKKINLKDFEPGGKYHFTPAAVAANPASVLQCICVIYRPVRHILTAMADFPLFPVSWRAAMKAFILLMNNLCI